MEWKNKKAIRSHIWIIGANLCSLYLLKLRWRNDVEWLLLAGHMCMIILSVLELIKCICSNSDSSTDTGKRVKWINKTLFVAKCLSCVVIALDVLWLFGMLAKWI